MRRCWLWFALLVLLSAVLPPAQAARYAVGLPIDMNVDVGDTTVGPGQVVRLTVNAADRDTLLDARGNPAGQAEDAVTITYSASGGQLSKHSVGLPVELAWQAPMKPGEYAIYLTADDSGRFADDPPVKRVVSLTVARAGEQPVATVRVAANPQTIWLDQRNTATITAQLFGDRAANQRVTFYATGGQLSAASAVTDRNGRATVRLTVGEHDLGAVTVTATAADSTSTTTLQVLADAPHPIIDTPPIMLPPPPVGNNPPGFTVMVNPPSIPADGESTAQVMVRLTDVRGLPIPRQHVVFRSTAGAIAPRMSVTGYNGYAVAEITAPTEPGGAYIVVDAGAMKAYGIITFTPVMTDTRPATGVPRVFLTIDPTEQMANGAARVRVEAMVLDSRNRPLVGTPVEFSTTLGRLQQSRLETNEDGKAVSTLIAPDRPGLAVVTAKAREITAASQMEFIGGTAAQDGLEIPRWTGQQSYFVAPNWVVRQIDLQQDTQTAVAAEMRILDEHGRGARTVQLGSTGVVISDQYGHAHGYCVEEHDTATVVLLKPDGTPTGTIELPLKPGSDVRDVRYAEPAGNLLVLVSQPDGTRPEVYFYSPAGEVIFKLDQGLEQLPVAALGGDGYLALALPGGTVRLYNPTGQLVYEGRRTDGLPAVLAAVGPNGDYVAVASSLTGQTERSPMVSVFGRGGGVPFTTFKLEATALTPVAQNALAVSTPERTYLLNLQARNVAWQISGGYQRLLPVGDVAVLAGHQSDDDSGLQSRITLVRLQDGRLVMSQPFDMGIVIGLLPPDATGAVGVLSSLYAFRFKLPGK